MSNVVCKKNARFVQQLLSMAVAMKDEPFRFDGYVKAAQTIAECNEEVTAASALLMPNIGETIGRIIREIDDPEGQYQQEGAYVPFDEAEQHLCTIRDAASELDNKLLIMPCGKHRRGAPTSIVEAVCSHPDAQRDVEYVRMDKLAKLLCEKTVCRGMRLDSLGKSDFIPAPTSLDGSTAPPNKAVDQSEPYIKKTFKERGTRVLHACSFTHPGIARIKLTWAPYDALFTSQMFLTGPTSFLVSMVLAADSAGYDLTMNGLKSRATGRWIAVDTEKQIFDLCSQPYIPPTMR